MSLSELYQEVILDHSRRPRHSGKLEDATHTAEGYNPFCGDQVRVFLRLDGDTVAAASFESCGCAISTASASMMTDAIQGKRLADIEALSQKFQATARGESEPDEEMGELAFLAGVSEYPNRVKCATMAWHALREAINGPKEAKDA